MLKRAILFALALTMPALAQSVPVPAPRPDPAAMATSSSSSSALAAPDAGGGDGSSSSSSVEPAVPLPHERPNPLAASSEAPAASAEPGKAEPAEPTVPAEPRIYQTACPAVIEGKVVAKALPPIHEGQCGLQSPLSLEAVVANGRTIPLNAAVITDCGMATALPEWIAEVDSYTYAHDKVRIETINASTNYACRNVDNAKTGNLSFHAFADAIDIVGFTLSDKRTISIAPGFNGTPEQGSTILHFARDAACTHFMTVLGPDADSFHQDNMHLDLACHGKTCMTRLCQ